MKNLNKTGEGILLVITLIVGCLNLFAWGFVLSKTYEWFILHVFPNARIFTIKEFIALWMFLSILKVTIKEKQQLELDEDEKLKMRIEYILQMIVTPWIILLGSFIIKTLFI